MEIDHGKDVVRRQPWLCAEENALVQEPSGLTRTAARSLQKVRPAPRKSFYGETWKISVSVCVLSSRLLHP
ncbi:predicted protein [Coccidioides posadasii str. Silveira]|uniref:Predicted protein n=1 Tax=Coccidioides posadasii (strain RMSCC 757 / Silveira) TaxID=443226 RepID=E9CZP0_COCPS|nr:predicted protein [Coccidioides posadasii str. Silveira]